jgi:predicted transcriptional regulator
MAEARQLNFDFGHEASIPYILISLKEQWHKKILLGDKRFEYRRQFIRTSVHVFIYVSGFVRGICAYAEFGTPIIGSVDKIISIYKSEGMQNTEGLINYFRNRNECFAIPIEKYQEIPKISLDELRQKFNSFTVPQSYLYLDKKPVLLNYLLEKKSHLDRD